MVKINAAMQSHARFKVVLILYVPNLYDKRIRCFFFPRDFARKYPVIVLGTVAVCEISNTRNRKHSSYSWETILGEGGDRDRKFVTLYQIMYGKDVFHNEK